MSLAGAVKKLNATTRTLKDVCIRGLTKALEDELGSKELLGRELPRIYRRAAAGLVPIIRQLLSKAYRASGLEIKTGELYAKSVTQATIRVSGSFLIIEMGTGGTKRVYASAGAFRFGAVRNTQFKTTYVDLPTGATKHYKAGKGGVIGAKAKRSIKKRVLGGQQLTPRQKKAADAIDHAVTVIRPKDPFFNLNNDIPEIEAAFTDLVADQIRIRLRSIKRGAA